MIIKKVSGVLCGLIHSHKVVENQENCNRVCDSSPSGTSELDDPIWVIVYIYPEEVFTIQ
jgi:hypothetical protein